MTHSSKKGRLGISTVVGGAFVVGILLTIVVPLFAYYNNMNNYYDSIATEMRGLDQQRNWEAVDAFATETEEGYNFTIINISPAAMNITRIWIVPNNMDYFKIDLNENLRSGDTLVISSDEINSYLSLFPEDEDFSVKIASDKGNYFDVYFPPPEPIAPGYVLPLLINQTGSTMSLAGNKYTFSLNVSNWMKEEELEVDYVIVTTVYNATGGAKSEISTINVEPNAVFNPNNYPPYLEWVWYSPEYGFSANANAIVIKIELVDINNYVIGSFYYEKADIIT